MPYQPADDEVLAHRFDGDYADVFFSVWTNHGNARPHYYVCLDENGGSRSWWLDPQQAELLRRRLLDYGAECRELNANEEVRQALWRDSHPTEG